MTEAKTHDQDKAAPEQQASSNQGNHKNPVIGPKSGNALPEWNRFRDYESFNPTPEK